MANVGVAIRMLKVRISDLTGGKLVFFIKISSFG